MILVISYPGARVEAPSFTLFHQKLGIVSPASQGLCGDEIARGQALGRVGRHKWTLLHCSSWSLVLLLGWPRGSVWLRKGPSAAVSA